MHAVNCIFRVNVFRQSQNSIQPRKAVRLAIDRHKGGKTLIMQRFEFLRRDCGGVANESKHCSGW